MHLVLCPLCPSSWLWFQPLSPNTKQKSLLFTATTCENTSPIVSDDTSFKSSNRLIEFGYEGFIHCQTFEGQESQVRQSFAKVNTGPDVHTNALKHTQNNAAPRGLGHPADSILFLLNGSCVTKDNLASPGPGYLRGIWMCPWLTCGLRFLCFVLENVPVSLSPPSSLPRFPSLPFLLVSSGLQRLSWEPGWLPCWGPPTLKNVGIWRQGCKRCS